MSNKQNISTYSSSSPSSTSSSLNISTSPNVTHQSLNESFSSKRKHNRSRSTSSCRSGTSNTSHSSSKPKNNKAKKKKTEDGAKTELDMIECYLESDDLWKKFSDLGTEMIITKSGRRMFPSFRVSFNGIKLTDKYLIAMDIIPTDNKRYRYAYHRSSWLVAGKADPPVKSRLYIHPDGPFTGDALQKQIVSFEKLKLTNNESDKSGHVRNLLIFLKNNVFFNGILFS